MVFQKICWEEPQKQKTRSRRAQELSRSCAQWKGKERETDRNRSQRQTRNVSDKQERASACALRRVQLEHFLPRFDRQQKE